MQIHSKPVSLLKFVFIFLLLFLLRLWWIMNTAGVFFPWMYILRFIDNAQLIQCWRRISSAKYVQDVFVHRFYAENFNLFWGFITTLRICCRTWHPSGNMVYMILPIYGPRESGKSSPTVCNKKFPKINQDLGYIKW